MIRKLGLKMNVHNVLFISKSEGFRTTAEAVNLLSGKIDELVSEVNRLAKKVEAKDGK